MLIWSFHIWWNYSVNSNICTENDVYSFRDWLTQIQFGYEMSPQAQKKCVRRQCLNRKSFRVGPPINWGQFITSLTKCERYQTFHQIKYWQTRDANKTEPNQLKGCWEDESRSLGQSCIHFKFHYQFSSRFSSFHIKSLWEPSPKIWLFDKNLTFILRVVFDGFITIILIFDELLRIGMDFFSTIFQFPFHFIGNAIIP